MIAPFTVILLQINYSSPAWSWSKRCLPIPASAGCCWKRRWRQDIATVEAASLFAVLVTVTTQIIGDLGYMYLNPRIRFA
jgi:peptide/nickel transport system permease protein